MTATQMTFTFAPARSFPRARRTDPDTSQLAARQATALQGIHNRQIVAAMKGSAAPLAAEQIADRTGLSTVQVCRRLHELVGLELIEPTAFRHRNRSGRQAVKYQLMEEERCD